MIKRMISLILVIVLSIPLSGCWDYSEYDSLAQIIGVGIDFNPQTKETTVTIQYISTSKPEQSSSGSSTTKSLSGSQGIVHSASDKTVVGALTKLQQIIIKKFFFGYMKVVVVGKEAAKRDMADIIGLCDRTPSMNCQNPLKVNKNPHLQ